MTITKALLQTLCLALPWNFRRMALQKLFRFQIHASARIGCTLILSNRLRMGEGSRIGHLNLIKGLFFVELGQAARIGNLNWITGFPLVDSVHFGHLPSRTPVLSLGAHSAITNRHLIDCTGGVIIGKFSTFAGFQSQILTHSIDIAEGRQDSHGVTIGDYCFVGTRCVLLGGAVLPNYCVLAAMSLLRDRKSDEYVLYGGVPALQIKPLSPTSKYFLRAVGFVN